MSTETVPVQEETIQEVVDPAVEQEQPEAESIAQEEIREEQVPLSALQKERRKRQEMEHELRWHKEQMMAKKAEVDQEPDESLYESVTKEDLGKVKKQLFREVEESNWIKSNPERAAEINDRLPEFLKQRPNLASAIEGAQNRYEEAWELMDKLSPKQKATLRQPVVKKDAPGNPAAVPKAAAMNQAVDFMQMSDAEFNAWRKSQVKRR